MMASREALLEALGLKDVTRAGWIRAGVANPESVAAHSWGMALLATQLCPDELDLQRVLELCILHDIAEVRVGDITPHDDIHPDEKHRLETQAIHEMGIEASEIFAEYESQSTPESRFVRYLDKLDMALQAEIYESQNLDLSEFKKAVEEW
ncbi:MAG TPA: HD domain-containing protein [Candidatus Thalassarchaeaceae archaeon]|jgi:putative hydrolase of HD superfamily|nr:HD domain-containing protein [Candidatus Thalassarchaeaceae archaeon]